LKTWIVIPTYNEAENLPPLLKALFDLPLDDLVVLIVDDDSPDGTGNMAEELSSKYDGRVHCLHRAGKLGLGTAYIEGFQFALKEGAEAICQMDADFSHPLETIPLMARLSQEFDLVIGSRYVAGGALDERWPLWRKFLSGFGNTYARTILRLPVHDVTGGFRFWRRATLAGLPLERVKSNGYVFQVEMVYIARKLGFNMIETPIYFADRRWGKSKMSFRIQLEAAIQTWHLIGRYRDLGKPSVKNP
jgi:dolichol-phosphate mannosyltransferase